MYEALENNTPLSLMDFVAAARARIRELTPEQLRHMQQTRPELLVLDVRESSEHEQSHIADALLVPRGILEAAADPAYPKHVAALCEARERPVVLYCATGGRSAMAALTLQLMGFKEVYSLAGGITQWEQDGCPLVREARYV
ncbi:MAG TPA: rhodanese-like domain-containing protein [Gammaproteobacteria bacterium]|nr:rhodanese-like domain-containing protein [Gammaproteobacteria bacterium]